MFIVVHSHKFTSTTLHFGGETLFSMSKEELTNLWLNIEKLGELFFHQIWSNTLKHSLYWSSTSRNNLEVSIVATTAR